LPRPTFDRDRKTSLSETYAKPQIRKNCERQLKNPSRDLK
jgi:hypothetical protein